MESPAATQRVTGSIVQRRFHVLWNRAEEVPCPLEPSCISAQLRSPLQWFLCGAVPRVVARRGDWEPDMLAQRVGTSGPP